MSYVKEFLGQRLIVFLIFVCLISVYGVLSTHRSNWAPVALLIGAFLFIILEYVTHRYLLHEFPHFLPAAYKGHMAHHQFPQEIQYLFGPVIYDVIGYFLMFGSAFLITGCNLNLTFSVVLGSSLFQLYYQWKHYVSHRPISPVTRWGKQIKKWHLLHHHMDEKAWYGVSNPIVDIMLGTNRPQKSKVSDAPKKEDMPLREPF